MLPRVLYGLLFVLTGPAWSGDLLNGDFEAQSGWLVDNDCAQGAPPAYAPGQGVQGSQALRMGRRAGQDGCRSVLAQAFHAPGPADWFTTVSFRSRFLSRDGEEVEVRIGLSERTNEICMLPIPESEEYEDHHFSVRGCDDIAWVEFDLQFGAGEGPTPLMQSTLYIDDVTCRCSQTPGVDGEDEYKCAIIFGAGFNPPVEGKEGYALPRQLFRRGDVDADGRLQLNDAIGILDSLFVSGVAPGCLEAADANDDGHVDVGDTVWTLFHLFAGGPAPPPPGPASCGRDPTPDGLGCASLPVCG